MGRRDYELSDAMGDAWTAARVTGGRFRRLVPVYGDRFGLAYQVIRGERVRRQGLRLLTGTALIAAAGGAVLALAAERFVGHRAAQEEPAEQTPAPSEAAFTG